MKKKHTLPSAFNCLKTNGCQRKLAIPSNTLSFISFLLILFSFQLSKAQMSQWALFPNKVTIPATGALSFQNIAATQPYITSNSAYDINGNLLFIRCVCNNAIIIMEFKEEEIFDTVDDE